MICDESRRRIRNALRDGSEPDPQTYEHVRFCRECRVFLELGRVAKRGLQSCCPDGFTLASWVAGELAPHSAMMIAAHLVTCSDCALAVDEAVVLRAKLMKEASGHPCRIITWSNALASSLKQTVHDALQEIGPGFWADDVAPVPIQGIRRSMKEEKMPPDKAVHGADGEPLPGVTVRILQPPCFDRKGGFSAVFEFLRAFPETNGRLWMVVDLGRHGSLRIGPALVDAARSSARFEGTGFPTRAFSVPNQAFGLLWDDSTRA